MEQLENRRCRVEVLVTLNAAGTTTTPVVRTIYGRCLRASKPCQRCIQRQFLGHVYPPTLALHLNRPELPNNDPRDFGLEFRHVRRRAGQMRREFRNHELRNPSILNTNIDAQTNIGIACSQGLPYQVQLDGGLSGATNPTLRRMTKGAEFVTYGLYRDAARTLPGARRWEATPFPAPVTATRWRPPFMAAFLFRQHQRRRLHRYRRHHGELLATLARCPESLPTASPPGQRRQATCRSKTPGEPGKRSRPKAHQHNHHNRLHALCKPTEIMDPLARKGFTRKCPALCQDRKGKEGCCGPHEGTEKSRCGQGIARGIGQRKSENHERIQAKSSVISRKAPRSVGPCNRATAPSRPSARRFARNRTNPR